MRHAIFIVFEYVTNSFTPGSITPLLGMENDIHKAFELSTEMFSIPKENITILTDIPAAKLLLPEGVNIHHYDYPNVIQLVIDLVKIMSTISSQALVELPELFVYYSGHAICLPDSGTESTFLILKDFSGQERNYLSHRELLKLFNSEYRSDEFGLVTLPITRRVTKVGKYTTLHSYVTDQTLIDVGETPVEMPRQCSIFFLYDACHSGSLSGLKYQFNGKDFIMLHNNHSDELPFSVGVGATNDSQEAPSCRKGSPFTNHIHSVIKNVDRLEESLNLINFTTKVNHGLHKILRRNCSPTVTASHAEAERSLPIVNLPIRFPSFSAPGHRRRRSKSWRQIFSSPGPKTYKD